MKLLPNILTLSSSTCALAFDLVLQGNKELLLYAGRMKEDYQEATTKA